MRSFRSSEASERGPARRPQPPEHSLLHLQRDLGNAAVARLLARAPVETEPPLTGARQWHERGVRHYAAGRYEEARAAFAEAYRLNPVSTFLYDQAEALEKLQRFAEAADFYERYLAAGPLSGDLAKVASRIRRLRGDPVPDGLDDDEPPITEQGTTGAKAWFDRAQAAFGAGRFAKAAECFRKAYELMPLPEFIFNEGSALEKGEHFAAAANAYEHYLILAPGVPEAPDLIAKIKALRGQAPAATKDSLIDPEDTAAEAPPVLATGVEGAREWYTRGTVAYELGDYRRAYDCFVRAYDEQPYPAFVFNQAASLDLLGNVDAAVQAYERYLALDPRAKDAAKVRGRIKRLRDQPSGADVKSP